MGGAASVEFIVSMVIRPNSVMGGFQDVALEDIEAESNKDIEILRPNFLQGISREAMNKLLSLRLHFERLYAGKEFPAIHPGERVVRSLHPRVEAKVKIV